MAAGAFSALRENVPSWFSENLSTDLSAVTLKSLELLMLAQAQECFLIKATADNKAKGILAKLAAQAADLYDQSYDAAPNSTIFEGVTFPSFSPLSFSLLLLLILRILLSLLLLLLLN